MGMFIDRSSITVLTSDNRFVSAYSPKHRVSLSLPGDGGAKQSFKDECDINVLMRRYQQTGILDGRDPAQARYMDVSDWQMYDFQTAQNFVASATSQFYELPSSIRARFDNDPGALISFMDDPRNAQEAISLGLMRDPSLAAPTVPLGTAAAVSAVSSPGVDQAKNSSTISAT